MVKIKNHDSSCHLACMKLQYGRTIIFRLASHDSVNSDAFHIIRNLNVLLRILLFCSIVLTDLKGYYIRYYTKFNELNTQCLAEIIITLETTISFKSVNLLQANLMNSIKIQIKNNNTLKQRVMSMPYDIYGRPQLQLMKEFKKDHGVLLICKNVWCGDDNHNLMTCASGLASSQYIVLRC